MSSYALQLPNNYVEIEREEMEYVDGGSLTVAGVISIATAVIASGGALYGMGTATGNRVYYSGYTNEQYQKDKWYIRAGVVGLLGASGGVFMMGFENAYYAKVTGK